jgi:hypothetical protein
MDSLEKAMDSVASKSKSMPEKDMADADKEEKDLVGETTIIPATMIPEGTQVKEGDEVVFTVVSMDGDKLTIAYAPEPVKEEGAPEEKDMGDGEPMTMEKAYNKATSEK